MLSVYPACFFHEKNGYSVVFPDLNWLATQGDTLEEAMTMAVECLAGYLYSCAKDGEPIPAPSPMSAISPEKVAEELDVEPCDSFVNMVSVDAEIYAREHFEKSVRKTLTIPSWLNNAALEQGINFSQTLQDALLTKVQAKISLSVFRPPKKDQK